MSSTRCLMFLAFVLFSLGCGKKNAVIVWPELQALDHATESAEAKVKASADPAQLAALAAELADKCVKLLASPVPAGVKSPDLVHLRLRELKDLHAALADPSVLTDAHLLAFHPVVAALMDAAGMPHVHDDGHDHDHVHAN
jgi:hypothetical protein